MSSNQADLDIGIGGAADPFATGAKGRGKIHVRIQQRNGRKCITTIQGLDADLDLGRIMKNMKKNCACVSARARAGQRGGCPRRLLPSLLCLGPLGEGRWGGGRPAPPAPRASRARKRSLPPSPRSPAPPPRAHAHSRTPCSAVNTNGNIVADEEMGEVIQLQGDQRQKVKEWILDQELVTVHEQDRIVIHGF